MDRSDVMLLLIVVIAFATCNGVDAYRDVEMKRIEVQQKRCPETKP